MRPFARLRRAKTVLDVQLRAFYRYDWARQEPINAGFDSGIGPQTVGQRYEIAVVAGISVDVSVAAGLTVGPNRCGARTAENTYKGEQ